MRRSGVAVLLLPLAVAAGCGGWPGARRAAPPELRGAVLAAAALPARRSAYDCRLGGRLYIPQSPPHYLCRLRRAPGDGSSVELDVWPDGEVLAAGRYWEVAEAEHGARYAAAAARLERRLGPGERCGPAGEPYRQSRRWQSGEWLLVLHTHAPGAPGRPAVIALDAFARARASGAGCSPPAEPPEA